MKRGFILLEKIFISILALVIFSTVNSEAKEVYPSKPIQILVPNPPGGATDQLARMTANKLEPLLGQKVIVVNKAGGGGTTGAAWVAQQKPDGYTILLAGPGYLTSRTILEKIPYSYKDFDYIAQLCFVEEILAVKMDAPWKTIEELIEDAKKNPGKYSYSTSGLGSMGFMLMETIKNLYKIDVTHVPFKGGAPALTALLGGHVHLCASEGVFEPHIKAKTLRKLFTGVASKFKTDPNVKNFEDLGHDIALDVWGGLAAPKGTPKENIKKLEEACKAVCADESFKEFMKNLVGFSAYIDGEGFGKKVHKDYMLFKTTLDRMGLSAR